MHYIKGTGVIDVRGRKVCSKRQLDLRLARSFGFRGDSPSFTRLLIESRVSMGLLKAEYSHGWQLKQQGAELATA
jgi:hypothetical protein